MPPDTSQNMKLSKPPSDRLEFPLRIAAAVLVAGVTGMGLGLSHGGKMMALRFRAENAHRLPTSQRGWYFYHKSKNYNVMLGSVKEGVKMGGKLALLTSAFLTIEEVIDVQRWNKDFLSTTVAGLTVAGAFSLWNRFPLLVAAKTCKMGLALGLGYGLAQDAVQLLKGRRLAYVDGITSFLRRGSRTQNTEHGRTTAT